MNKETAASLTSEKQRFEDFAGYTTLHGLHYVFDSQSILRRLIWLVLILVGLGFCTRQLIVSYGKLTAHGHVISKEIIPSDKLTFPAVTLCNMNMMKKSKILGTDAETYLNELDVVQSLYDSGSKHNRNPLNNSFDIKKAVDLYGHKADDMINMCVWDGEVCSHLNFTKHYSYMYGLCYTFNSGQHGHRLLHSTSTKQIHGLSLVLQLNKKEYIGMSSYMKTGVRVLIHDQYENLNVEDDGIDVMPAHTTTIRFKKTKLVNLPPPYKSACGRIKLETSNVYTTSVCLQECQTRQIIQHCGCKLLGMPDLIEFKSTKHCTPKRMKECGIFTKSNRTTNNGTFNTFTLAVLTTGYIFNNIRLDCDCPLQCTQKGFQTTQINVADFLSESFWIAQLKAMNNRMNLSDAINKEVLQKMSLVTNDLVHLNIQYEDLNTYITRENPAYDINDFGADVGGYVGLFLGCSVLTIFEFIDLIIVWCFDRHEKKNKYSIKNTSQRSDEMNSVNCGVVADTSD